MKMDHSFQNEAAEDVIDAVEERVALMFEGARDDFTSESDLKDAAAKCHGFVGWTDYEDWKSGIEEDRSLAEMGL